VSADGSCQETTTPGRLRIYLGYAPGAGATCALLREGRQRARLGADVVVARVDTHGRPYTQALLAGLEIIPGAAVPCLGAVGAAMDLGAVLARRPGVALVDELAFARAENATQLVLGATRRSRLSALLPWRGTTRQVIRRASGLDVHIITCPPVAESPPLH